MKKIILAIIASATLVTPVLASAPSAGADTIQVSNTRAVSETRAQYRAKVMARNYLDYTAFSRKGLISQLRYEGFSYSTAVYAVDHITVSWRYQAYRKAKEYLDYTVFSRSGLYDQLRYEGFTITQATYGVNRAY